MLELPQPLYPQGKGGFGVPFPNAGSSSRNWGEALGCCRQEGATVPSPLLCQPGAEQHPPKSGRQRLR